MKVLVVDDSPTMRRIVVQMLKRLGYADITEANDGKEALAILRGGGGFGLLLTDWNMPIMNGLELVQAVRSDDQVSSLPILMVTTRNMKQDIVAAMRAGVNNYVTKPFDPRRSRRRSTRFWPRSGALGRPYLRWSQKNSWTNSGRGSKPKTALCSTM